MRTNIYNNLSKCRMLLMLAALFVFLSNSNLSAQNAPVYQDGNVAVYQYPDGWEILHGTNLVGYGEGTFQTENLSPAFQELLDFYAAEPVTKVSKRPKKKAAPALTEEYGPLIKTKWKQGSPYNDLFPQAKNSNNELEKTLTGCTSISSGMMMYFYRYCTPFEVKGTNTIEGISPTLTSPFFTDLSSSLSNGKTTVTFSYDFANEYSSSTFTPDFDLMDSDPQEISKYLLAIAFVQQAGFGLDVTLTFRDKQMSAIKNKYGYDYVNYNYRDIADLDLTYNNVIADAIKKGWPVIVGGQTEEGSGHSYIIDGVNGDMFHFEYGWGGTDNGWFSVPAKYCKNYNFIIAHPNIENFAYLKADPKYLYIKGVDNDFDDKFDMQQTGSNKWSYCQKEPVDLPAGTYEFYFEYEDGSKIAPCLSSAIELDYSTSPFAWTGLFTSNPAKFTITEGYKLNFWHKLNSGEIMIEGLDFNVAISGKVLDKDNNPVAGALVSTYYDMPVIIEDQSYEIASINWSVPKYPSWRKNTFEPSSNCLAGVDIKLHSKKGEPGALIVAILDNSNKVVCSKKIPYSDVITGGWMHVDFDETAFLVPYETYYVALASEEWQSGTNTYYCFCDDAHNIAFRTYASDAPFIRTGSDGSYSYTVNKYSSLTLTAFSDDMFFNSNEFNNVTENLTDQNLVQTGFRFVDISGSVFDKDNNPIEGALVTTAKSKPVSAIDQSNPTPGNNGNRVYTNGVTKEFVPTKKCLAQLDLMLFRKGDPGFINVSIADMSGNKLWEYDIPSSTLPTGGKKFLECKFEKPIAVTPGQSYTINLISDVCNDDNRCNYYVDETNHQLVYQVWGCDNFFVISDATGKYTYRTDAGWSGSLYAYYDDKTFDAITVTELWENAAGKDFKEKQVSNNDPVIESISVVAPTKTEYLLGEELSTEGMVVTAHYNDGSEKEVDFGYELSGFDSENIGECTVNVTYSSFVATFKVTVAYPPFTITYKVDNEVYKTVELEVDDPITAIDGLAKTGFVFKGWSPALPEKMPAKDLEVNAEWDYINYSLTYYVDGKVYGEAETYHYGDAITMKAAPTKEGYTFEGWTPAIPEKMPAENLTVAAEFEINSYTVTYIVADTVYSKLTVAYNQAIAAIAPPTQEGADFVSWTPSLPDKMPAKDLSVNAVWEKIQYSVTYYVDDKIDGEVVKYYFGDAVTMRAAPQKEGFTFSGWDVEISSMPSNDVVVKGTFTKDNPTPVSGVENYSDVRVWAYQDVIYIENAVDADYSIVDLSGRTVKMSKIKTDRDEIRLGKNGLFVVTIGGRSFKVVLTE
ncbi:MAG: C10 family peptidase [Bacteroidales bacterium]|nr:C10 family peptidase [Bacteroidales bacterium]